MSFLKIKSCFGFFPQDRPRDSTSVLSPENASTSSSANAAKCSGPVIPAQTPRGERRPVWAVDSAEKHTPTTLANRNKWASASLLNEVPACNQIANPDSSSSSSTESAKSSAPVTPAQLPEEKCQSDWPAYILGEHTPPPLWQVHLDEWARAAPANEALERNEFANTVAKCWGNPNITSLIISSGSVITSVPPLPPHLTILNLFRVTLTRLPENILQLPPTCVISIDDTDMSDIERNQLAITINAPGYRGPLIICNVNSYRNTITQPYISDVLDTVLLGDVDQALPEKEVDVFVHRCWQKRTQLSAADQWKIVLSGKLQEWRKTLVTLNQNFVLPQNNDQKQLVNDFASLTQTLFAAHDYLSFALRKKLFIQLCNSEFAKKISPQLLNRDFLKNCLIVLDATPQPQFELRPSEDIGKELRVDQPDIAKGVYGSVLFMRGESGRTYAAKFFGRADDFENEFKIYEKVSAYEKITGQEVDILPQAYGGLKTVLTKTQILLMEKIDGANLKDFRNLICDQYYRGQISFPQLIGVIQDIANQIFHALEKLKAIGIVHCDLKPDNIMVTLAGKVKLVDVGRAFSLGDELSEEVTTPSYADIVVLNPEICDGKTYSDQHIEKTLNSFIVKTTIDQFSAATITMWLLESLKLPQDAPDRIYSHVVKRLGRNGLVKKIFPRSGIDTFNTIERTGPQSQRVRKSKLTTDSSRFIDAHTSDEEKLARIELTRFLQHADGVFRAGADYDGDADPNHDLDKAAACFLSDPLTSPEEAQKVMMATHERAQLDRLREKIGEPLPINRKVEGDGRNRADGLPDDAAVETANAFRASHPLPFLNDVIAYELSRLHRTND